MVVQSECYQRKQTKGWNKSMKPGEVSHTKRKKGNIVERSENRIR